MRRPEFIITFCFYCIVCVVAQSEQTYRAATVEYEPFFEPGLTPQDVMLENARRYSVHASLAAQQNAKIVVFPEFGLSSFDLIKPTRDEVLPISQDVPDPREISWNPCLEPNSFNNTQVLHLLSCAARNNSIAILANVISREPCDKERDPNCPVDNRYQFNTNVVFDRRGLLIARYHKKHLFLEPFLDAAPQPEYVIFEVDGIEFGTFICFDIMYEEPAVKLVLEKKIKNIIFSTAWGNQLPFILGHQVFSQWARGLGVNLIVSNYHNPQYARVGTGIYTSQNGALAYTFDISTNSTLLVADLPLTPQPVPEDTNSCSSQMNSGAPSSNNNNTTLGAPFIMVDIPSSKPMPPINKIYLFPLTNFSAKYLDDDEGDVALCNGNACCYLSYSINRNDDAASYAIIAYDGLHSMDGYHLGMQTCSVMRCDTRGDVESCGHVSNVTATSTFNILTLTAHLDNEIVMPNVVNTDLHLVSGIDWQFSIKKCEEGKSQSILQLNNQKVEVVALYARLYDRDIEPRFT